MRYRINQIKMKPGQPHSLFETAIRHAIGGRNIDIKNIEIIKESIDARKKPNVKLIYTLDFDCDKKLNLPETSSKKYKAPVAREDFEKLSMDESVRPVVVGYGPAGMFAALMLASWGLRPIVLERGQDVDQRVKAVEKFWDTGKLDTESNVQFGEGGAGTFSDGKLTTNVKDVRIRRVLEEFVNAGADQAILYKQKPHIGTDKLREIVKHIRKKTIVLGGEFRFSTRLENIILDSHGRLEGITIHDNITGEDAELKTTRLLLATGHSAADTFNMLYDKGIHMEQKPFSIGVRVEHPQDLIDKAQYGNPKLAELLGHADYKLHYRCDNGRGVYTFCMCPGGYVINSASEESAVVTNGMSNSQRDSGTANSGLLVDVRITDFASEHPLAGIKFQRIYEKKAYEMSQVKGMNASENTETPANMPRTTYEEFRNDSHNPVRACLPEFARDAIIEAMPHLGEKLQGFDDENTVITAVETRSSSPVRILRDNTGNSSIQGIMPAGEGPGYAGGIMSAAIDGIKAAEKLALQIKEELQGEVSLDK